jgi:dihydroflavonol-4-reductase
MTTLITGATGFVGAAVLRRLLEEGHQVRVLVRPCSNRRNLEGLSVDIVEGDLKDASTLRKALGGCRYLFHVAADYRLWSCNPDELYANNVVGTRNIMLASSDAGVERIVYTSSVATLGLTKNDSPSDENTPVDLRDMIGDYKRSKYLAELEVLALIEQRGLPAVIVNPSTPIGAGDIRPTPTGRMILDAVQGRIPFYVRTGLNLAHVDDVASGHQLALHHGTVGERYILGGHDLSLQRILHKIAAMTGGREPFMRIPHAAILPIAYLSEAWAAMTGGNEPRVTVAGVRLSEKTMYFSSEKACRVLGYKIRPLDDCLQEAVEWFQNEIKQGKAS